MKDEINTWLFDILNAIEEIDSFFSDSPKEFSTYLNNLRTRRAIERNIEIIGEALSRIITHDPSINISNIRNIIDTRNRIIHGYDSVSNEIMWSIIIYHIPVLHTEVLQLLEQLFWDCRLRRLPVNSIYPNVEGFQLFLYNG